MIEFVERKRWVFFALPFTFTKYTIKEDVLTIQTGILKIQDVQHSATLGERIFGIGTITCFTGDTTHPKLELMHIKNSRAIKDFILQQSEEARLKRRTVNTLDIGSGDMTDVDDM